MNYVDIRNQKISETYFKLTGEYLRRYRPGRPTVILLPGGMGSQLDTLGKFDAASVPNTLWVGLPLLLGKIDSLSLRKDGRDRKSHIIVPARELTLFEPYSRVGTHLANSGFNVFVFPYDWRRSLYESASWLREFLKSLKDRVMDKHHEDPLPQTTLLCHSMGGLAAKMFLEVQRRNYGEDAVRPGIWFKNIVTAATPFYGTSNHMIRYYRGDKLLNLIYDPDVVASIAATMPGPYILMFLSKLAYENYKLGFSQRNEEPELQEYPMRDQDTDEPVDPYEPASHMRYPEFVRNRSDSLLDAARDWDWLSAPLPQAWVSRVFHLRSDSPENEEDKTYKRLKWADDPSAGEPIVGVEGQGDGTVPTWSARLADIPSSQVKTISNVNHSQILRSDKALRQVVAWVAPNETPPPLPQERQNPISDEQAREVIVAARAGRLDERDARLQDPQLWQKLFPESMLC